MLVQGQQKCERIRVYLDVSLYCFLKVFSNIKLVSFQEAIEIVSSFEEFRHDLSTYIQKNVHLFLWNKKILFWLYNLQEEIRDKLTPIEVKMTYELLSTPAGNIVPPVLDQTQSVQAADSLIIQKNCGPDNICIPDLKMSVTTWVLLTVM